MLRKMGWKLKAVVHSTSTKREVAEDHFLMMKRFSVLHALCWLLCSLYGCAKHLPALSSTSMDVQNTSQHCLQQYGCSMTNYFPGAANVPIHTHLQLDVGPRRPRAWHMVHPFYCQPDISTECQLIIFGGNAHIKGDSGDREDIADLRILTLVSA